MRRTKAPDTLPDGRVLGAKTADLVPKDMRDQVPESKTRYGRARGAKKSISQMCRTRMPLSMTEDGEITTHRGKIFLRGMNQGKFNALLAALKSGMTRKQAIRFIGIHPDTLRNWLNYADEGRWPYTLIIAGMEEAEAELEIELLEAIRQAGTERIKYKEQVVETIVNEHGETTTKSKVMTKVKWPQWNAAAWILERTRPDRYAADRNNDAEMELDITAEITAMRQISDMGRDE